MRAVREVGGIAVGGIASSSKLGSNVGVLVIRKKVGCSVGRARFDMPVPCRACRTVIDMKRLAPFAQAIGGSSLFCAQERVKENGGSQNVLAVFQLGRSSISKNVYERFLFSRSFHSPPSLKAASPADFA